jgi:hypothetical protein
VTVLAACTVEPQPIDSPKGDTADTADECPRREFREHLDPGINFQDTLNLVDLTMRVVGDRLGDSMRPEHRSQLEAIYAGLQDSWRAIEDKHVTAGGPMPVDVPSGVPLGRIDDLFCEMDGLLRMSNGLPPVEALVSLSTRILDFARLMAYGPAQPG